MRFSSITEGFTLSTPADSTLDIPSAIACWVCATARSVIVLRLLPESESFPGGWDTGEEVFCSGVSAGGAGVELPSSADCGTEGLLCSVWTGVSAAEGEDEDGAALGPEGTNWLRLCNWRTTRAKPFRSSVGSRYIAKAAPTNSSTNKNGALPYTGGGE